MQAQSASKIALKYVQENHLRRRHNTELPTCMNMINPLYDAIDFRIVHFSDRAAPSGCVRDFLHGNLSENKLPQV